MANHRKSAEKEVFWPGHLSHQASGGLSIRAYCPEHSLSEPSFYVWRREIARRDREQTSAANVPRTSRTDIAGLVAVDVAGEMASHSLTMEVALTSNPHSNTTFHTNPDRIVRFYIDDGTPGDNIDRDEFVRMIEDAEKTDDFEFVLVRHQSRFARFRPAKTIRYLDRLDDASVRLVTSKQGEIDVNDLAQFLIASIEAQTDHTFSRTLSELTIRGQARKAQEGYSAGKPLRTVTIECWLTQTVSMVSWCPVAKKLPSPIAGTRRSSPVICRRSPS